MFKDLTKQPWGPLKDHLLFPEISTRSPSLQQQRNSICAVSPLYIITCYVTEVPYLGHGKTKLHYNNISKTTVQTSSADEEQEMQMKFLEKASWIKNIV